MGLEISPVLAMFGAYDAWHVHSEGKLHEKMDELQSLHDQTRAIADLMNALNRARKDGRIDITKDERLMAALDLLKKKDPTLFPDGKTSCDSKEEIDWAHEAFGARAKTVQDDFNKTQMEINEEYGKQRDVREAMQAVMRFQKELMEFICGRMGRV